MSNSDTHTVSAVEVISAWRYQMFASENAGPPPCVKDRESAEQLIEAVGAENAVQLARQLAIYVSHRWPQCKRFSGAWGAYGPDVVRAWRVNRAKEEQWAQEEAQRRKEGHKGAADNRRHAALRKVWDGLPEDTRKAVRAFVLRNNPGLRGRENWITTLCVMAIADPGIAAILSGEAK